MPEPPSENRWFAVRCVFVNESRDAYEERITLWRACSVDEALALAEADASSYARDLEDTRYVGLAQAFEMFDPPGHGAEIFSLIRVSELSPDEYLNRFFDTGREHQQRT